MFWRFLAEFSRRGLLSFPQHLCATFLADKFKISHISLPSSLQPLALKDALSRDAV